MNRLNIIIHGLHSSGSSAVLNLLRNYKELVIVPGEFDLFRRAGMVGDTISRLSNKNAMPSVLDEYLAAEKARIRKERWLYYFSLYNIKTVIKFGKSHRYGYAKRNVELLNTLNERLKGAETQQNGVDAARIWIDEIGNLYEGSGGQKKIVFEHAIDRFEHEDIWPEIFSPFRLIMVYRDPRDQLADLMLRQQIYWELGYPRNFGGGPVYHANSIQAIYGRDKEAAIRLFRDAALKKFDAVERIHRRFRDCSMLMDFEGFIKNHVSYTFAAEKFISLENPGNKKPYNYLDLEKSALNIGIYKRYLNEGETGLLDEVTARYNQLKEMYPVQ